ncbi:MAG TPA: carbohydrate kinase family protein [Anaerolineae bacterium]|nr:carbohydrate kinase family protein [Anaerolineae bacterium]
MVDLYCIGGISVDLLLKIPRFPEPNEKLVVKYAGHVAGGLIANTACAAARLGLETSWSGLLGSDEHARMLMKEFALFGVNTADVIVKPDSCADFTVILLHPDGERTILIAPILPSPPPLTSIVQHALQKARLGYTIPYAFDWFEEFAGLVHTGGGKVAVDLEACAPEKGADLKAILRCADIVFYSEGGLRSFISQKSYAAGAADLLSQGAEMVVLTLGKKGALLFSHNAQYSVPAFDVSVKDTTGAGDCFHAAFLYGILANWELSRCLEFASAAAALSVQKIGARQGLPILKEVEQFLLSHSIKEI